MRRDLRALEETEFDLAVVGGGIFGICTAWDAALRGLRVALIERGDFAEATSAHSFRMVHGGIRYLQHADVARIREAVRERRALLRIAPHLVHPLPIVIPTYGHGIRGKAALRAGFRLYDLCAADRNRGIRDPARRIPAGRIISRAECLRLFPELEAPDLTGAGIFADGQMYHPPRLALAFLRSAVEGGAVAANYVAARCFARRGDRVVGVEAADMLGGGALRIRARVVVNTAGPWAPLLLRHGGGPVLRPDPTFSRDVCLVLARPPRGDYGLAILGGTRDPDALVSRAARHLFLVPWRGYTLLGVWHKVWRENPDAVAVTQAEVEAFLEEVNRSCPALGVRPEEVSGYDAGLVLFGDNAPGARDLRYGHRSRIVDHAATDGVEGLITSIGVRWTTARGVAAAVVSLAGRKLGRSLRPSRTEATPVYGGRIADVRGFVDRVVADRPAGMAASTARDLARKHGTAVTEVLARVREAPSLGRPLDGSAVIGAEVVHAVREEMAQRLADVVYRRTDLATGRRPSRTALAACAELMGAELGWTAARFRHEIALAERGVPAP